MSRRNFEAVVNLLWTLFTLLFMLSMCLLHIFLYIFFINIGCATLYHLSMMYLTVYNMSFKSNCRILAAELNYRFTLFTSSLFTSSIYEIIHAALFKDYQKNVFIGSTAKNGFQIRIVQQKIHNIKSPFLIWP